MSQTSFAPFARRLIWELRRLRFDPLPHWIVEDENIHKWIVKLFGPPGSPYEGGVFKLKVNFSLEYPIIPPKLKFITPVFHPRVSREGHVDLRILTTEWSPDITMEYVLLKICELLADPHPQERERPECSGRRDRRRERRIKHTFC